MGTGDLNALGGGGGGGWGRGAPCEGLSSHRYPGRSTLHQYSKSLPATETEVKKRPNGLMGS